MEAEALVEADPVNPMRLFHELSSRLPPNAIVAADSGSSANWYARHLRFHGDMRGSLSGNLATMGPGVPYEIGAKFGNPDRPVFVFAGDGAMQMNGLAELITIKHYWQEWSDPRLVIAVLHNNDLNRSPGRCGQWKARRNSWSPRHCSAWTTQDSLDQMKDTGRAIFKGGQDRWGVVKEGVLTKVQELLPHKED